MPGAPDPLAILYYLGAAFVLVIAWFFPRTVVASLFWYILGGWWGILFVPLGVIGFLKDVHELTS